MANRREVPEWETLLAHAAGLQTKIPGAVLVGGTAAALHAKHRYSVQRDYDKAFAGLESIAGWRTNRQIRGKLILGEKDGIAGGLRDLRRAAPLETVEVNVGPRRIIRVPTIAEMLRIKAFLVVDRNATRDYLDVAALSHNLGKKKAPLRLSR